MYRESLISHDENDLLHRTTLQMTMETRVVFSEGSDGQ